MFSFPMAAMRQLNIPQVGRGEHGGALPYRFDTGACVRGICFIAKWSPRLPTPTTFTPQISQLDLSNGSAAGELDGRWNLSLFKNTEVADFSSLDLKREQAVTTVLVLLAKKCSPGFLNLRSDYVDVQGHSPVYLQFDL